MGIYNSDGKLVRTLHHEAQNADFTAALNGLVTYWDGKDDRGALLPSGRYQARGYVTGDTKIEGESYHCNDWATDENPVRISRILDLRCPDQDALLLQAQAGDSKAWLRHDPEKGLLTVDVFNVPKATAPLPPLENETVIDTAAGMDNCSWAIIRTQTNCEVRQYSSSGDFQRRLSISPNDPQPTKIAASTSADVFYLLEENASGQRVRGFALAPHQSGAPSWKIFFTKTLFFNDNLEAIKPKLLEGRSLEFCESIPLTLQANPLLQGQISQLVIKAGTDGKSSFLQSSDGLLLRTISETPALCWVTLARQHDSKTLTVFQSDGAVVEEFSVSGLSNIMAFDCGEFDFVAQK